MKSYIITQDGISLYINGKMYTAEATHPNYDRIKQAIIDDRFDTIPGLINRTEVVKDFLTNTDIEVNVDHGAVTYKGEAVRGYCVERILEMKEEGFNVKPMTAYLDRLMKNPSKRAVDELHRFNEYGRMPITEDGYFIAYKRISGWYDTYTRTVLNKPADLLDFDELGKLPYTTPGGVTVELMDGVTTVSMPRNRVDDRSENTCSDGLHFCSQEYLKSFSGDRIVVLKIDPADVVSIPVDYNNTKGRCCRYQVIDVLSDEDFRKAMGTDVFTSSVYNEVARPTAEDEQEFVEVVEEPTPQATQEATSPFSSDAERKVFWYKTGYADSRKKIHQDLGSRADLTETDVFMYEEGYKDGKGHKPKKFK